MKKIKLLLPTLLIATYAPVLSTSLTSCNKFKVKEHSVKASKHLATFKVTGGDGTFYSLKDQDDSKIKLINKFDRVEESGKFYDVINIAVIPQPDSSKYTCTLKQTNSNGQETGSVNIEIINESDGKFENDSWTNVITHANQGLDHLKQHYGVSTFVGLERAVIVNNLPHTVRVVGENADTYGNEKKLAALTFEFTNMISESIDKNYEVQSWAKTSNKFTEGETWDLYNKLKDSNSQIVRLLPDYLIADSAIKMTNRRVIEGTSTEWTDHYAKNFQAKLFLPCISDVFSNVGILKMKGDSSYGGHHLEWYKDELVETRKWVSDSSKTQYEFYRNQLGDAQVSSNTWLGYPILDRPRPFNTNQNSWCWWGTPSLYYTGYGTDDNEAWTQSNQTTLVPISVHPSPTIGDYGGIAPLFCI